jgi:hypothetical protein
MFEYISRKRDPIALVFYCGAVPFGILWVLHNSRWTGYLLEAYLITMIAFVIVPFETRQKDAKQRWFWKIMLWGGAVVHPPLMAGLWYVDATYPSFVTGTGTLIFVAFGIGVVEALVLGETADRFRPKEQGGAVLPG